MEETAQIPCLIGIPDSGATPDLGVSRRFRGFCPSQETVIPSSRSYRDEVAHSYEIEGSERKGENRIDASQSTNFDFTDSTYDLLPSEDLLDTLALALTYFVSFVTSGPLIDRTTTVRIVLRNVRRHAKRAQLPHEVARVIALVGTQGDGTRPTDALDHLQSRFSLGGSRGQRQAPVYDQTVPVLHERMAKVSQLGSGVRALAAQPRIGVRGRAMRLIAAFRSRIIDGRIATGIRAGRFIIVDRPEALVARPGLDQRAVDGEMLVAEQTSRARLAKHGLEEALGDLPPQEPLAVLGEHRHVPNRVLDAQAHEPAEEHVVLQLLDQLSLAADGVEHLQQQRPQLLLRCNRRAPVRRLEFREGGRELVKRSVDHDAYRSQRVIGRNQLFGRDRRPHRRVLNIF